MCVTSIGVCREEGAIVCNKGMIVGEKGVSLDDLVYTTTKMMRQMDADGLEAIISAADTVSQSLADAKPLVDATTKLIDQVCIPLNAMLRATNAYCSTAALLVSVFLVVGTRVGYWEKEHVGITAQNVQQPGSRGALRESTCVA